MILEITHLCGQGLVFAFDGFRIIYSLIALFMWAVCLLFSGEYFAHYSHKLRYYSFLVITMFATIGVFLSADFMTTFIFFEIMSLSSYVWVAQEEKPESLKAGITYLAVAVIGGMVMLMGLFLLYDAVGTLRMGELSEAVNASRAEKSGQIYAAGFCMLFGFGAKAGMFPLHFWLPKAHPVAPAPASALLSGILTKCGIFGILVLTAQVFAGDKLWGNVILCLGVITMVVGAVLAVFSVNLKRTLACSSVSQIGFILVGVAMQCFLREENALAVRGTFLHMVNHSLIKLLLFNCAGVVYMNLHALDLNDIRGYGRRKPFLKLCFLMGAFAIGGIPLWSGYVSKTLLHESIVEYVELLAEAGGSVALFKGVEWAFLISGGLTVAYMAKLFICLFIEKHPVRQAEFDSQKHYMTPLSKAVIGLAAVILPVFGCFSAQTMNRLADAAMPFMRSGPLEHEVHYFIWGNLKGGLISIAIGALVYALVIRTVFIRRGSDRPYVNLWPEKIDVEAFFTWLLQMLLFILGTFSRLIDRLPEQLFAILKKMLEFIALCMDGLTDSVIDFLRRTVYRETTEKERNVLVERFHEKFDETIATGRLIGSSLSFGLLFACVGLLLTILYLLFG